MKTFSDIAKKTQKVVERVATRVDGQINGANRAIAIYGSLPPLAREAMKSQVELEFGKEEWDSFQKMMGGKENGGT